MTFEYQLTLADLRAGLRAHRPDRSRSRVIATLACASLVIVGAGILLMQHLQTARVDAELRTWAWVCVAIGVALFVMMCAQEVAITEDCRRLAEASEVTTVAVGEDGLKAHSRGVTAESKWERFRRFHEGPEHFLLYHNAEQYLLFPKRALGSEAEVQTFRELLRRSIP